jgi:hypothetical protein
MLSVYLEPVLLFQVFDIPSAIDVTFAFLLYILMCALLNKGTERAPVISSYMLTHSDQYPVLDPRKSKKEFTHI